MEMDNMVKYLINAILVVTVPRLAYILGTDEENYKKYLNNIFNVLILILAPCVAGLWLLSKPIIMLLGGEQYLDGEASLIILSFSLIFALIASVFSNCILIINRLEKRCLVGTITSAAVNVALNYILIPTIGITGAALTTVLAECINMIIQAHYSYKDLDIKLSVNKWTTCVAFLEIAAVIVFCKLSEVFWQSSSVVGSLFEIVFSIVCSAAMYLLLLRLFRGRLMKAVDFELFKK